MKKLKQILKESIAQEAIKENIVVEEMEPKVYNNIQPSTLMALAKRQENTRFVIHKPTGTLHAGDAYHFIHHQIRDSDNYDMRETIRGILTYDKKTDTHTYAAHVPPEHDKTGNHWNYAEHPILDKLEEKGAKRGVLRGDYDYQTAEPSEFEWAIKRRRC